jgi:hypothetical protein
MHLWHQNGIFIGHKWQTNCTALFDFSPREDGLLNRRSFFGTIFCVAGVTGGLQGWESGVFSVPLFGARLFTSFGTELAGNRFRPISQKKPPANLLCVFKPPGMHEKYLFISLVLFLKSKRPLAKSWSPASNFLAATYFDGAQFIPEIRLSVWRPLFRDWRTFPVFVSANSKI